MLRLILLIVFILLAMIFLGIWEGVFLSYYEETRANRFADYVSAPLILYVVVAVFVQEYRFTIKRQRILHAVKQALMALLVCIGVYFIFFRPVVSGAIVMTNHIFRDMTEVRIEGVVVDKIAVSNSKGGDFEIVVKTDGQELTLDTNGVEVKKYDLDDVFKEHMSIGLWGLVTKAKSEDRKK